MKKIWRKMNSQKNLRSLSRSQKKSSLFVLPISKMRSWRMVMTVQILELQMTKAMLMFSRRNLATQSSEKDK
jgi:hypothetical protein